MSPDFGTCSVINGMLTEILDFPISVRTPIKRRESYERRESGAVAARQRASALLEVRGCAGGRHLFGHGLQVELRTIKIKSTSSTMERPFSLPIVAKLDEYT